MTACDTIVRSLGRALLAAALLAGCGSKAPSGAAPAAPAASSAATPTETAPQAEASNGPTETAMTTPIIDHTVQTLAGETVSLSKYRGSVLLIVNTASECGYTPQYAGLQRLYDKYAARGLVVVGFPSNDYGGQEPGDAEQIASFCKKNYGVTFPMMAKVHAKGAEIAPIYKTLTQETPDGIKGDVRWNFTKFLVDVNGKVVARFESKVEPESADVTGAIEKLLPR
jgi:glutathione peroxidase